MAKVFNSRHLKAGEVRKGVEIIEWVETTEGYSIYKVKCVKCSSTYDTALSNPACGNCRLKRKKNKNIMALGQIAITSVPEPIIVEAKKHTEEEVEKYWRNRLGYLNRMQEINRFLAKSKEEYEAFIKGNVSNLEDCKLGLSELEDKFNN